jgi:hypothetical protein
MLSQGHVFLKLGLRSTLDMFSADLYGRFVLKENVSHADLFVRFIVQPDEIKQTEQSPAKNGPSSK